MTATTTIPGLEATIECVYRTKPPNFGPPAVVLEDAFGMWWYDTQDEVFDRWTCEADACPARPAWDKALALFRERMADFTERFRAEHHEAVLREVTPE